MPVALRIRTRNLDHIKDAISALPRSARGIATEQAGIYLIGNQQRGLRHYAPYKYVTRESAYGVTFFSDKQRRFVMAAIREGRINPGSRHATGALAEGWQLGGEKGVRVTITNAVPYAPYVQGDAGQSRHEAKVGWRKVSKVVADNMQGALHRIEQVLQKWLKQKGLS